jgi:hypothetical protein
MPVWANIAVLAVIGALVVLVLSISLGARGREK